MTLFSEGNPIVPRSCIGQDFAYMEARIIVAVALRKFDFVPMYRGTMPYQIRAITAKPVDGMPMKVVLAKSTSS